LTQYNKKDKDKSKDLISDQSSEFDQNIVIPNHIFKTHISDDKVSQKS